MHIRVRLMGMLKDRTPADEGLELDEAATIEDALTALDIPVDSVQVFSVNGSIQRNRDHVLRADDELTVLPPVGGG